MALPPGTTIPLSPARRFMCDLMHASRKAPIVAIERHLNLRQLIEARQQAAVRPSWFTLFLKGYALVCQQRQVMRRSYLSFPWPRLHQHACNVANLAVARKIGEDEAVLSIQLRHPEQTPLPAIDEFIRRARTEPIETFGDFRRLLLISRLPRFLRRLAWWIGLDWSGNWRARFAGTFGITGVAALGSASLHTLSPLTSTLTFGVFEADGSAPVRLFYDHRVLDGIQPALALADLEQIMNGPILEELRRTPATSSRSIAADSSLPPKNAA